MSIPHVSQILRFMGKACNMLQYSFPFPRACPPTFLMPSLLLEKLNLNVKFCSFPFSSSFSLVWLFFTFAIFFFFSWRVTFFYFTFHFFSFYPFFFFFFSCSELFASLLGFFLPFIFPLWILWCSYSAARIKTNVKPVSHVDLLCSARRFSFMFLFVTNYHGL